MAQLPKEGITLKGGCYCSTVRYTIIVPPLSKRPVLLPSEKNQGNGDLKPPLIGFDHCNDCRRAAGSVLPIWFICPQSWIGWTIPISKEPFPVPTSSIDGTEAEHRIQGGQRISISTEEFIQRPPELEGFVTHYNSSPDTWRTFCTRCGTNLSYVCLAKRGSGAIPMLDVVLGSLDKESLETPGVRPDRHFYWRYGVEWVQNLVAEGDGSIRGEPLPRHPESSRRECV